MEYSVCLFPLEHPCTEQCSSGIGPAFGHEKISVLSACPSGADFWSPGKLCPHAFFSVQFAHQVWCVLRAGHEALFPVIHKGFPDSVAQRYGRDCGWRIMSLLTGSCTGAPPPGQGRRRWHICAVGEGRGWVEGKYLVGITLLRSYSYLYSGIGHFSQCIWDARD